MWSWWKITIAPEFMAGKRHQRWFRLSFIGGFTVYFWAEHIVELRPGRNKGIGLRTWVELQLLAERMCTFSEKKREF